MYCLTNDYLKSVSPWDIPLPYRCSQLRRYIDDKRMVSIHVYEHPDTSTFRYRGYNFMQITSENDSEWKCIYFFRYELKTLEKYLRSIHLITLIRMRWNQDLEDFIMHAKRLGIKVLFDVDDLVFDLKYLMLLRSTLNVPSTEEKDDFWFAYVSRIGFTASKAEGFTTTNEFLGKKLQEKYQKEIRVIPNFLNREQFEISESLRRQKAENKSQEPFTIGYFSGTPTHINDFGVVCQEILSLLDDFNMRLLVVGFMEFPPEAQEYIRKKQILFVPLVDFIELQRQVAQVDINIVPLVNNSFTNCKSEIKFFEAALVDTITVATPVFSYSNCIANGINGFLCQDGEWYEQISRIYKNIPQMESIVRAARDYSITHYSGEKILRAINSAYEFF